MRLQNYSTRDKLLILQKLSLKGSPDDHDDDNDY